MANKPITREVMIAPTGGPPKAKAWSGGQGRRAQRPFCLDSIALDPNP